ncbi:MAG: hypothetical protein V3W52_01720 [Syntrophobacteria bacterium]
MTAKEKDRAYPVIPSDRGDDLHNLECVDSADLVLFVAGNSENGAKFLEFIGSPVAQGIYERYGFVPHFAAS